jgi:plasmid stabilization system protein ParE
MPSGPYVLLYRVREEAVQFVRILDGRRDIDEIFA